MSIISYKKIIIFCSLSLISLNAAQISVQEKMELKRKYPLKTVERSLKSFVDLTDQIPDIKKSSDDVYYLKALDSFIDKRRKTEMNIFNKKTNKFKSRFFEVPRYQDTLYYLKQSGTLESAWLGATIIDRFLLGLDKKGDKSKIDLKSLVNEYYPGFLNKLMKRNICYGFYLASTYYGYYHRNEDFYKKILKKSNKACSGKKIPVWIKDNLNLEIVRYSAYQKLKNKKVKK